MASHRRGPWSQVEDAYLVQLVHAQGALNWVRIAQLIGSRSPKQCRERYHQNLKDPKGAALKLGSLLMESDLAMDKEFVERNIRRKNSDDGMSDVDSNIDPSIIPRTAPNDMRPPSSHADPVTVTYKAGQRDGDRSAERREPPNRFSRIANRF
jgi:hypothetical protein